jgi:hypothetical protein
VPLYKAKWKPLTSVSLIAQQVKNNFNSHITLEHMQAKRQGSAFFFFNSIEGIGNVPKKLIPGGVENIHIIASRKLFEEPFSLNTTPFGIAKKEKRLRHEVYLQKYIQLKLRIESTNNCENSPKNKFFTATAFENCNIYQKDVIR